MSETLICLLGNAPTETIRWALVSDGRVMEGGRLEGADGLAELSGRAARASLVAVLLPGEQVALRRLASPPRNEAKFRTAAAYLLEDELAEPIADLHVAISGGDAEGLAVAVKARIIEDWVAAFDAAGIDPQLISADFLALTSSAKHGTAIFEPERIVLATNAQGFAIDKGLFPAVAGGAFIDGPEQLFVFGESARPREIPPTVAIEWLGPAEDAPLLLHYAQAIVDRQPLNLLQGRLRKRRAWGPALAPWRRSGALVAATLAAIAVLTFADGLRAGRTADRFNDAARAAHQTAFPDAAGEDPVRHARSVLSSGGAGMSFLVLSSRFADAASTDKTVQIDRISFDAARGELVVSVRSASDSDIELLKQRLASVGVIARDNGGYRRAGAFWVGELAVATR